jgi:hypothetical protein
MLSRSIGRWPVLALALGVWSGALSAAADDLKLTGFLSGRGGLVDGPPSWLDGGFGRFTEPGKDEIGTHSFARSGRAEAQARLEWSPALVWTVRLHGLARYESSTGRARAGVAEAFVEFHPELTPTTALRFRLGTVFPSTSFENTRLLWSSPFTLTLSALDTWIAEELRPTALEATLVRRGASREHALEVGGAVLAGADTSGALLAWRGWTLGDRLVTIGERVPLPPLASFEPGGGFARQRSGTNPTAELDGRPGWMARVRWSAGPHASVQAWAFDNNGDRRLHRGEYAWRTQLVAAGLTLTAGPRFTLVADGMAGRTGMGPAGEAHVDIDFRTAYVLASVGGTRARLTGRYDVFRNVDRDHTAEPDDDDGHAWTAAALWSPVRRVRLALEAARIVASRPAAPVNTGGRRFSGEARIGF